MTNKEFSCHMCCGFFLLALLECFEFGVFVAGAIYLNSPIDCVGGAGHVSLPTWLFVGGLVGFIFNSTFVCLYTMKCAIFDYQGRSEVDEVCKTFLCLACGLPVALFLGISFLFRIAWFIVGLLLYGNLPEMCKNDLNSLYSLGIVFFVAMFASSLTKLMILSKNCCCE